MRSIASVTAVLLLAGSFTAHAQSTEGGTLAQLKPNVPSAPVGHRQPRLKDLPPDVARAEKSSDAPQSEPTPTDPGQHNVAHKARATRHAKASDRTSGVDREPRTFGGEDVTIPFIPPGEAGGRLPNNFRNCEEPIVPRFCPP
jgi:hypothetical protein